MMKTQQHEFLHFIIPLLGVWLWLILIWYLVRWNIHLQFLFAGSIVGILAGAIAFTVVRRRWIAAGLFVGVVFFLFTWGLLPPY